MAIAKKKKSKAGAPRSRKAAPVEITAPAYTPMTEDSGFSAKSAVFLVMALVLGFFVFSKAACKKGPQNAAQPEAPAAAGAPAAPAGPAVQGMEDAAKNGSPEAKAKNMASIEIMRSSIAAYKKAHSALPPNLAAAMPNVPNEAVSGSSASWQYCPSDGRVLVNLPEQVEGANRNCQGYFAFNKSLHDGSGNGRNGFYVGNKISYERNAAYPGKGAAVAGGFSNNDYVDLPPTVISPAMAGLGTIRQSVYLKADAADEKVSLASNHGSNSNFYILWQPKGAVRVRIPNSDGKTVDLDSAPGVYAKGRWNTIYVIWNGTGARVLIKDESTGKVVTAIKQTKVNVNFASPSIVRVGADSVYSTFGFSGQIGATGFYENELNPATDSVSPPACR